MSNLKGKRVAVLVEKFYEDLELWYPVLRLREAGADVTIVGPRAGETYLSKHGYPALSDAAADEWSTAYIGDYLLACRLYADVCGGPQG